MKTLRSCLFALIVGLVSCSAEQEAQADSIPVPAPVENDVTNHRFQTASNHQSHAGWPIVAEAVEAASVEAVLDLGPGSSESSIRAAVAELDLVVVSVAQSTTDPSHWYVAIDDDPALGHRVVLVTLSPNGAVLSVDLIG